MVPRYLTTVSGMLLGLVLVAEVTAQSEPADDSDVVTAPEPVPSPFLPLVQPTMKRLSEDAEVWIDPTAKSVFVHGVVTARAAPLEMFACPKGTKEYESVVAVNSSAQLVHTALLAIGAEPGSPMQFDPEYVPAHGPIIDITVEWFEGETLKSARAQEWVRNVTSGKPLEHDWVFGGSGFWEDPETGKQYYRAEGWRADLCVEFLDGDDRSAGRQHARQCQPGVRHLHRAHPAARHAGTVGTETT